MRKSFIKTIFTFFCETVNYIVAIVTEIYAVLFYNPAFLHSGKRKKFHFYGLNPTQLNREQLDKPAILFLHGQFHNQSGALPLAKQLQHASIGPVFTINLKYNEKHPEKHERLLQERIAEIKQLYEEGGRKNLDLILIGHSRGGIEALNYICHHKPKDVNVVRIITIAARIGITDILEQWRACPYNIKILIENIVKERENYRDLLYHVASNKDWRLPLDSALYNTDKKHHHIVKNRSHMGILYAGETHRKVIEYIRQG